MTTPREDNRGILRAARLRDQVKFRRHPAAEPLRRFVEHYWLIDWDLATPHLQQVVPHPCVNVVWESDKPAIAVGVELGLTSITLSGRGRVFGVQFRPGGFGPFISSPMSELTGRRLPPAELFGTEAERLDNRLHASDSDADRVALVDEFLLALPTKVNPASELAMTLAHRIRTDRTVLRVADFSAAVHRSPRSLHRLFERHIGVGPKWVIQRYRIHEAIELAGADVAWAELAHALGYADQAHLAREFRTATGMSPTAYARSLAAA